MILTKEHYDIIEMFEKVCHAMGRKDKEEKQDWSRGVIYKNGQINEEFIAFRKGYMFGKSVGQK